MDPSAEDGRCNLKNSDVLARLKNVEGHVRGVERMVEKDEYCIDIIRQIQAIQAALNKVSSMVLEGHLNSCLITAVRGDDPAERERVFMEIGEVFDAANKV
jgi:DNA-binding FrmR family transcriptional regulator